MSVKATSGDEYRSSPSESQLGNIPCFGASLSVGPAVALQATSHCGNLRAQHSTRQPSEALSAVKGGSEEGRKGLRLFQGKGLSGRGQQGLEEGEDPWASLWREWEPAQRRGGASFWEAWVELSHWAEKEEEHCLMGQIFPVKGSWGLLPPISLGLGS